MYWGGQVWITNNGHVGLSSFHWYVWYYPFGYSDPLKNESEFYKIQDWQFEFLAVDWWFTEKVIYPN